MSSSTQKSPMVFYLIQIKAKILTMTNITPHDLGLCCLYDFISYLPSYPLFSSHTALLAVPCTCFRFLDLKGIVKAGPHIWSTLPAGVWCSTMHFSRLCWNVTFSMMNSLTSTPQLTVSLNRFCVSIALLMYCNHYCLLEMQVSLEQGFFFLILFINISPELRTILACSRYSIFVEWINDLI